MATTKRDQRIAHLAQRVDNALDLHGPDHYLTTRARVCLARARRKRIA